MNNENQILEELRQISPAIATISRNNVYSVPLNYFDGLACNIMQVINADIAGSNFGFPQAPTPFTVPQGYFSSLADTILNKVKSLDETKNEVYEELAEVAPLLNTISKTNVYHLPVGHFDTLTINTKATQIQPAKVRSIGGVNRVIKYAAAAAITGLLAVGTYFFTSDNPGDPQQISSAASINIATEVNKISNDEIVDYLEDNTTVYEMSSASFMGDEDIDINASLEDMSEEEIRQYLKENEEPQLRKSKNS